MAKEELLVKLSNKSEERKFSDQHLTMIRTRRQNQKASLDIFSAAML